VPYAPSSVLVDWRCCGVRNAPTAAAAAKRSAGSDALLGELPELLDPAARPVLHRLLANAPTGLGLDFDAVLETGVELRLDGVAMRHLPST
jgi:hypothetical protein